MTIEILNESGVVLIYEAYIIYIYMTFVPIAMMLMKTENKQQKSCLNKNKEFTEGKIMICKKCGKDIKKDAVRCSGCGKFYKKETASVPEVKTDVKKNIMDNGYKMAVAIMGIISFFLPWFKFGGRSFSLWDINSMLNELSGNLGGGIIDFGKIVDSFLPVQFFRGFIFVQFVLLIVDIVYIVAVMLDKESYWMMGCVVLLQSGIALIVIFAAVALNETIENSFSSVGLGGIFSSIISWSPFALIILQTIFAEIANKKQQETREEGYPYLVE